MKNVMIDIETMGVKPGSIILSIGAVRFTGEEFYKRIDLTSAMNLGLTIEPNTLIWWLGQSGEARQEICKPGEDIKTVLSELMDFIKPDDIVWANSPAFDCVIIKSACELAGVPVSWKFWNERDVRTVTNLTESWIGIEKKGVAHNALDDCKHQIECVTNSGLVG